MKKQYRNKPFLVVFAAVFGFTVPLRAAPPSYQPETVGITLEECYKKALTVSESLAISDQEIEQIAATYRQGVGRVLPAISWQMTQLWQDTSVSGSSTTIRRRTPEAFFQLEQPIFHGLREYYAVKGAKSAKESARFTRDQAALNLLVDVADVFFTSLDLQQELEALGSQRKLTDERLTELERRVRLGRSRDSEVLSSQVEMASLDAQIEDTRQRWGVARQTLLFLTEVPPTTPLKDSRPEPDLIALENALGKVIQRPDVRAAEETRQQEQFGLRYARGGFSPDVDARGRYFTERVGALRDVKWDVQLALDVPIFTGFITRAEVQEAKSRVLVADLAISRTKRQAKREIETAHQNLSYTISQTRFYKRAVELAERNYKLQQQEYRLGLINNLQVLQVLSDLQDLQISKLRAEAAMRLNEIRLRVATGQGL